MDSRSLSALVNAAAAMKAVDDTLEGQKPEASPSSKEAGDDSDESEQPTPNSFQRRRNLQLRQRREELTKKQAALGDSSGNDSEDDADFDNRERELKRKKAQEMEKMKKKKLKKQKPPAAKKKVKPSAVITPKGGGPKKQSAAPKKKQSAASKKNLSTLHHCVVGDRVDHKLLVDDDYVDEQMDAMIKVGAFVRVDDGDKKNRNLLNGKVTEISGGKYIVQLEGGGEGGSRTITVTDPKSFIHIIYCQECNSTDTSLAECASCCRGLCTYNTEDGLIDTQHGCLSKIGGALEWHYSVGGDAAYRCNTCVKINRSLPDHVVCDWTDVLSSPKLPNENQCCYSPCIKSKQELVGCLVEGCEQRLHKSCMASWVTSRCDSSRRNPGKWHKLAFCVTHNPDHVNDCDKGKLCSWFGAFEFCIECGSEQADVYACHQRDCKEKTHLKCQRAYEKLFGIKDACQDATCPHCHPKVRTNKSSQPTGVSNGSEEEALSDETREEKRLNSLCTIFEGHKLKNEHKIGAPEKRERIQRLVGEHELHSLLTGGRLTAGTTIYNRFKSMTNGKSFKTKPIKEVSQITMKLGMLLHDEFCKDEVCNDCSADKDVNGDLEESEEITQFRELYELCNQYHLVDVAEGIEKQSRKRGAQAKKGQTKSRNELFKPNNSSKFELRYIPGLMDGEPCPCCGHMRVRKIHAKAVLEADEARVEKEKAERLVTWNATKTATGKKKPREGKKMVQEYYCLCFQWQENECNCAVGPFKDADREWIPGWHRDWLENRDDAPRPTVSDNVGNFFNHMVSGAVQMGDRRIREMNAERTIDTVQGAAVDFINHGGLEDNMQYMVGTEMGVPTERFPDGTHVSSLQRKPVGDRYYRGSLGLPAGASTTIPNNQHATSVTNQSNNQRAATTPQNNNMTPVVKGVSKKRTKRQLKKLVMTGSPATQMGAEGALEDLLNNNRSTARDHIMEAEEESEPEPDEDTHTASQQVALEVVHFKKIEYKRKGSSA